MRKLLTLNKKPHIKESIMIVYDLESCGTYLYNHNIVNAKIDLTQYCALIILGGYKEDEKMINKRRYLES